MKKAWQWLVLFFLVTVLLFPIGSSACGCGVGFDIDPTTRSWHYSSGDTNAVISYIKGREQLVIARSLQAAQASDKILLIPVPAKQPNDVQIDVLTELPILSGTNLNSVAGKFFESLNKAALFTQFTPLFIWKKWNLISTPVEGAPPGLGAASGAPQSAPDDVTVYQHLDKAGLSNEVITAKFASSLAKYFQTKGLTINPETIPVLDAYIGKEYAFVASWRASNSSMSLSSTPETVGLAINFATQRIFYPLLPSSTFGQKQLTETVRIIGLHQPKLAPALESYTYVEYDLADQDSFRLGDQTIEKSALTYTTVNIQAPSSLLTEDLWFQGSVPLRVTFANGLAWLSQQTAGVFFAIVLWIAIISILAGVLAGMLAFRRVNRQAIISFAKLSLWNLLTIIGLTIALIRYQPASDGPIPITGGQKVLFWFLFTILVTILSISLSLGIEIWGHYQLPNGFSFLFRRMY